MRLDLGLLQMETQGRPDGLHPHGYESLLEYHNSRLRSHEEMHSDNDDFVLTADECSDLKQEAMQYYYRYLSLFPFGRLRGRHRRHAAQFETRSNLVRDHAEDDTERTSLEQFRPYVLMMNTRAKACCCWKIRNLTAPWIKSRRELAASATFSTKSSVPIWRKTAAKIAFLRDWSERILSNRPLSPQEN